MWLAGSGAQSVVRVSLARLTLAGGGGWGSRIADSQLDPGAVRKCEHPHLFNV
jgi:hypothetical protein